MLARNLHQFTSLSNLGSYRRGQTTRTTFEGMSDLDGLFITRTECDLQDLQQIEDASTFHYSHLTIDWNYGCGTHSLDRRQRQSILSLGKHDCPNDCVLKTFSPAWLCRSATRGILFDGMELPSTNCAQWMHTCIKNLV